MKTIFKLTILSGAAISAAIATPVAAAPQSVLTEFEGRYVEPKGQFAPLQQSRLQAPKNAGIFGSTYGDVYDYESGHCGRDCAAPTTRTYRPAVTPQFRPTVTQQRSAVRKVTQFKCWDGEIVATESGCKPQTITKTIPQFRCWDGEVVTDQNGCKPQTVTRQRQAQTSTSSYGSSSYTSGPSRQNCPAGTAIQSDGTCLDLSSNIGSTYSGSSIYSSGSSYSSGNSGSSSVSCPSGTVKQADGICLGSNSSTYSNPYAGLSVELYTGN